MSRVAGAYLSEIETNTGRWPSFKTLSAISAPLREFPPTTDQDHTPLMIAENVVITLRRDDIDSINVGTV